MGNSQMGAAGGSSGHSHPERSLKLELDIQKAQMGKLIGTGGKTIQSIQMRAQHIHMKTPSREDTSGSDKKFVQVILLGKASDVFQCAEMVGHVVDICLAVMIVSVSVREVPLLLRDSVQNVDKEIPIDTLRLPRKHDKHPRVILEGYLEDVIKAYHTILADVEKAAGELQEAKEMEKWVAISNIRMGQGEEGAGGPEERKQGKEKAKPAKEAPKKLEEGGANTVCETMAVSEAAVVVLQKGRLTGIEKESRASLTLGEGGALKIVGRSQSSVNKAKRDVERLMKKVQVGKSQAAGPAGEASASPLEAAADSTLEAQEEGQGDQGEVDAAPAAKLDGDAPASEEVAHPVLSMNFESNGADGEEKPVTEAEAA